jgi:transcriptional regulator with XRE-family HTH domain
MSGTVILAGMNLGELLETRRKELNLTPDQVAARLEISRRHWDRLVHGDSVNIRVQTKRRMKTELGLSGTQIEEAQERTTAVAA